jgi:hypothetical protein
MLTGVIDPNVGTSGFNFLKVAPTAREAAMGNAAIGLCNNAFGLWYNPANLAAQEGRQFGISYISYPAGINSGSVTYAMPMTDAGFGIGGYYLNGGSMKRTDENGSELGTFSASYLNVNIAYSRKLAGKLMAGAALKLIYGGIDTFWTAGLGADLGLSYDLPVTGLRACLVARNLGVSVKPLVEKRDNLPIDIAAGFGYQPSSGLKFDLEAHKPLDNNLDVRIGAEGWIHKYVCLRLGITSAGSDLKSGGGGDVLAGLSTGLGVKYRQFELDYAFTPMVILTNAHRISIRYSFL